MKPLSSADSHAYVLSTSKDYQAGKQKESDKASVRMRTGLGPESQAAGILHSLDPLGEAPRPNKAQWPLKGGYAQRPFSLL